MIIDIYSHHISRPVAVLMERGKYYKKGGQFTYPAQNADADSKFLYDLFPLGPAKQGAKIAGVNTNITSFEARTGEGAPARINMTVEISDLKHLEKVIKTLQRVQGVRAIERLTKQDTGR